MVPNIIPAPVRVVVMVSVLDPVLTDPNVILMVDTETLVKRFTTLLALDLLIVIVLKVVAFPLIFASAEPVKVIVPVPAE